MCKLDENHNVGYLFAWKTIYEFHDNAKNIKVVGDSPLVEVFEKYNGI